jgi:hypothetical protein
MLGSAICGVMIFVALVYGYFWYQWSRAEGPATISFPPRSEKTVAMAPPIVEAERFLGSTGVMSGDFSPASRQSVLAAGPGKLVGGVTSSGKPLQGLRLRLALNGAVMSQWAESAADGRYEVAVPYGKYRVDGYELDSSAAHRVLSGKIEGPRENYHPQASVTVAEGKPGKGIEFAFVDPVRKKGPDGDVSLAQPVVLTWEPYPGASAYRIQMTEYKDPSDYAGYVQLFPWREQPVTQSTSFDLAEQKVALKKGYYYAVQIQALDASRRVLSETPRNFRKADFRVMD